MPSKSYKGSPVMRAVKNSGLIRAATHLAGKAATNAAATVFNNMSKRVMNTPETGRTKYLKRNRRFITTGRHAGYIKGYRQFKRSAPYSQRYSRALKGVTFQWERTVDLTDDRCVYITHHNLPYLNILKASVYAITKKFLKKCTLEFTAWGEPLTVAFVPNGTTFTIEWRQNYTGAVSTATCTKVAADLTFKDLADRIYVDIFINQFIDVAGIGFDSPAQLLSMETNLGGNVYRMNLRASMLDCICKSSLKMQNRSINATEDDESDDVNNVPLIGKSYQGKGNGFISKDNTAILPPADGVWGWSSTGAQNNPTLQEPPQPYHFQYATKVAKLRLQPGHIKTSVLNGKLKMEFDRFLRYCRFIRRSNGGATTLGYTNMGTCRMFSLERTIAKFATEVSPGITVAAELDCKLFLDINLKASGYTAPDNLVL